MMRMRGRKRVSALWAFMIQAVFISWAGWMPGLILGPARGYTPLTVASLLAGGHAFLDGTHIAVAVLFVLGSYGPLLSGLGIAGRLGGTEGVRTLLGRLFHWRLSARWYGIAVGLPLFIALPAVAVARMAGVAPATPSIPSSGWLIPVIFVFHLLTMATAEFGWRGTALALAQRRYTAEQASYIVGVLWAVWMLPYLAALYIGQDIGPTLPLLLIGWGINLIGASVVHTWLYNNTASLGLCMLYSAASMTVWAVAIGFMGWQPLPQLVLGITSWLVALILLRRYGAARLVRDGEPEPPGRTPR
jgi:hypothetical protein